MSMNCKEKECKNKAVWLYDFEKKVRQAGLKGFKASILKKLKFYVCDSHKVEVDSGLRKKGMSFEPDRV